MLNEQMLFESVRTMPLMIMSQAYSSSNTNIKSFCTNLIGSVALPITDWQAVEQHEHNLADKRLRTPDKTEYHKRMENNLLFELFKYSYMINVFEILNGRNANTVCISCDRFISLVLNDCKERVLNINQEIERTPSIKNLLQNYSNNNQTYPMPIIGTINQIENDYIVACLMETSITAIMDYIFEVDLQNTLQIVNSFPKKEIKLALNSSIIAYCSARLLEFTNSMKVLFASI